MTEHHGDLIFRLAHELGVALELHVDAPDMHTNWLEALEALDEAVSHLRERQLPVPGVAVNVLERANFKPAANDIEGTYGSTDERD